MYKVKYYKTVKGNCPFQDFLSERPKKVQGKFIKFLDILAAMGPDLKRPYADVLKEGIRELRVKFSPNQYRALYFFFFEKHIIITHGIVKKTDEVPTGEIERAIRFKNDFEARYTKGEIEL